VKKTEGLSLNGVAAVLELSHENDEQLRDLALMQFICFTGIRLADIDFSKTNEFKIVSADKSSPRRVVAVLAKTKNDMTGEGPIAGRTFVLPCICLSSLKGADKIAFAKLLKKDPCHQCSTKCPFDAVVKYLHKCPTYESAAAAATKDTLSFMRALSSRGGEHRVLTVNKLGLNQAKKSIENVSA
jgi:hypothetical protein